MKLNVAVQMDPIARINIRGDSTFALLLEAQKRGHGISYYTPDKLSLRGEELVAPVQPLTVRDEVGDHFILGEAKREAANGRYLPTQHAGGIENPLGARALYLGTTEYRIHGTNQPWTIGGAVSSGCIRMRNEDVVDLYERVNVGTTVEVI